MDWCSNEATTAKGGGSGEGRNGRYENSCRLSCAQNILKRVEERSERECTALDAHKELELVSMRSVFPSTLLPRPVLPSCSCSLTGQCVFGKCVLILVFGFGIQKSPWVRCVLRREHAVFLLHTDC